MYFLVFLLFVFWSAGNISTCVSSMHGGINHGSHTHPVSLTVALRLLLSPPLNIAALLGNVFTRFDVCSPVHFYGLDFPLPH